MALIHDLAGREYRADDIKLKSFSGRSKRGDCSLLKMQLKESSSMPCIWTDMLDIQLGVLFVHQMLAPLRVVYQI